MGFIISIGILLIIFWISDWLTHVEMVKTNTECYGKANYKIFLKKFNELDGKWDRKGWNSSLFYIPIKSNRFYDFDRKSEFHANIIMFDGKGMILNPIDFIRAKIYVKKYIKKHFIRNKAKEIVKWE